MTEGKLATIRPTNSEPTRTNPQSRALPAQPSNEARSPILHSVGKSKLAAFGFLSLPSRDKVFPGSRPESTALMRHLVVDEEGKKRSNRQMSHCGSLSHVKPSVQHPTIKVRFLQRKSSPTCVLAQETRPCYATQCRKEGKKQGKESVIKLENRSTKPVGQQEVF